MHGSNISHAPERQPQQTDTRHALSNGHHNRLANCWPQPRRIAALALLLVTLLASSRLATAQSSAATASTSATAWQDDADLWDIQPYGTKAAIAVGSHGVVWRTNDAGQSWSLLPIETQATLRSICFLTDKLGWIGGAEYIPETGRSRGVVLMTQDGGDSWRTIDGGLLPAVRCVKFFDKQHGLVIVEPTTEFPSGIARTDSGGASWQPVLGPLHPGWTAAAFPTGEYGILAGSDGRLAVLGDQQLLPARAPDLGRRRPHEIVLDDHDVGWLVGDGGLVLQSPSGGVAWEETPEPLPDGVRENFDFRAIEQREGQVWIGGSPGSRIWYSPDAGRTWHGQVTGSALPIARIRFGSPHTGWAVGARGAIWQTANGGRQWRVVRNAEYRAAVWAPVMRPEHLPAAALAKLAGEQGYRAIVQPLLAPTRNEPTDGRWHEAAARLRATATLPGWQFSLDRPDADRDAKLLMQSWTAPEGQKAPDQWLATLVRELRTWRPTVVLLPYAARDDGAAKLLHDAIRQAIVKAADGTQFLEHEQLAGLAPWQVERVAVRLAPQTTDESTFDPYEFSPRWQGTMAVPTAAAQALVGLPTAAQTARESFRIVYRRQGTAGERSELMAGLSIPPGSPARRLLAPIEEHDLTRQQKLAQRQRQLQAIIERNAAQSRLGDQLLAQTNELLRDLPAAEGARQLAHLAERYRAAGRFDLYEAAQLELVRRYPSEPAAIAAMAWLIEFWTSAEVLQQRNRDHQTQAVATAPNQTAAVPRIDRALAAFEAGEQPTKTSLAPEAPEIQQTGASLELNHPDKTPWNAQRIGRYRDQAAQFLKQLAQADVSLAHEPRVQFVAAALARHQKQPNVADDIYRAFIGQDAAHPWRPAAERELWLSQLGTDAPTAVAWCGRAKERPVLDGVLSDSAWQTTTEFHLSSRPPEADSEDAASTRPRRRMATVARRNQSEEPLVMLTRDDEFLYIAVSVPHAAGRMPAEVQLKGRQHDAPLGGYDRVKLLIDVDRDYSTWYELEFDERGWTSERCVGDSGWNPEWFVAADSDPQRWRIEAAIPLATMISEPLNRDHAWAVRVIRTIPLQGYEAWPAVNGGQPAAEDSGLLRFR